MWPTNAQDHAQPSLCSRSLGLTPLGSSPLGYSHYFPSTLPGKLAAHPLIRLPLTRAHFGLEMMTEYSHLAAECSDNSPDGQHL